MKSPVHPDIEMKQVTKYGITIDYCPKSGGVWLDKGELEKMIEFAKQEAQQSVDEESNVPFADEQYKKQEYREDKRYKRKKKRRFENPLEELFDIF